MIDTYGSTTREKSPDFTLKVNPDDPVAVARMADYRIAVNQSKSTFLAVEGQTKASLKAQPINARALRILAMAAKQRGELEKAERFIQLAHTVSRRELGTQIWLIDRAAMSGDAKRALYQYDQLLRSNPSAPKLLFPALGKALSNAEIRQNFIPIFKKDPPWLYDFLSYAVYNDIDPVAQAQLMLAANGYPPAKRYAILESALVERLVKTAHYPEAALVGQQLYPEHRQAAQQILLNSANVRPNAAPFQWQTGSNIAANSALISGTSKSEMAIEAWAKPNDRALAASKLLQLPSGSYSFTGKVVVNSGKLAVGSYWQISCINGKDQSMVWRYNLTDQTGANKRIAIGGNCPFQMLELYLEGGQGSDGARVTVSALNLEQLK